MPKKNSSRNSKRGLLISELVKTSISLTEFLGNNSDFDPFTKEETYESWTLEDLEDGLRSDLDELESFNISWELPERLKYIETLRDTKDTEKEN